jgi:DNA-binding transcriptional LysR family regulator
MMVALPTGHLAAKQKEVDLASLKDDSFVLLSRPIGSTFYDDIVSACRRAGFEPVIGQLAPQMASVINLVAAELGVSIVPASISQLRVRGVAYREIAGQAPTARLALAHRRGETSPIVRNFVARAIS